MNIYIVVCDDRHDDLEIFSYVDKHEAIMEARRLAKDYSDGRDYEEHVLDNFTDFLFYATYTGEGDSIIVVKTELNEKSNND